MAHYVASTKVNTQVGVCKSIDTSWCLHGWVKPHPVDSRPMAYLFLAIFTVDLSKLKELAFALEMYLGDIRTFLATTRDFYRMMRSQRNQHAQLNLYPDYNKYMEFIRYHCQALMETIADQIQDKTGKAVDMARSHIKRIMQLLRKNKDELYKQDKDGSKDKEDEPIYFTTERTEFPDWHKGPDDPSGPPIMDHGPGRSDGPGRQQKTSGPEKPMIQEELAKRPVPSPPAPVSPGPGRQALSTATAQPPLVSPRQERQALSPATVPPPPVNPDYEPSRWRRRPTAPSPDLEDHMSQHTRSNSGS